MVCEELTRHTGTRRSMVSSFFFCFESNDDLDRSELVEWHPTIGQASKSYKFDWTFKIHHLDRFNTRSKNRRFTMEFQKEQGMATWWILWVVSIFMKYSDKAISKEFLHSIIAPCVSSFLNPSSKVVSIFGRRVWVASRVDELNVSIKFIWILMLDQIVGFILTSSDRWRSIVRFKNKKKTMKTIFWSSCACVLWVLSQDHSTRSLFLINYWMNISNNRPYLKRNSFM